MLFTLGLILFVIGLVLSTVAFMHLKDGMRFWQFTPIWKVRERLNPPGPEMAWAGAACGAVGVILLFLSARVQ